MKTIADHKINNDQKRCDNQNGRLATLKSCGIIQGRLLNVPLPNPNMSSGYDESISMNGQYHWDCSDWVSKSHNALPGITEVPGSEVPDSSSFHSNESNESHPKNIHLPPNLGPVDPSRDIETLNEETESEFVNDSEFEGSEKPRSIAFDPLSSIPVLNPLDSGSEEYRFSTAESYMRHPNSYLPRHNIQSETDGEGTPLTGCNLLSLDIGSQQILESDDEEPYGFPRHRNRRPNITEHGGGENSLLLGSYNQHHQNGSNSDLSTKLCEIDDSELDEAVPPLQSDIRLSHKKGNWTNSVHQTDV